MSDFTSNMEHINRLLELQREAIENLKVSLPPPVPERVPLDPIFCASLAQAVEKANASLVKHGVPLQLIMSASKDARGCYLWARLTVLKEDTVKLWMSEREFKHNPPLGAGFSGVTQAISLGLRKIDAILENVLGNPIQGQNTNESNREE